MQQPTKALLQGSTHFIAISVTIGIAILSLIKPPTIEVPTSNFDKVLHCIAYFVLSICWLGGLWNKRKKTSIILACIIYGIVIEILQVTMTNYRTGDIIDILANTTGVLLGLFVFNYLTKNILLKKNERL